MRLGTLDSHLDQPLSLRTNFAWTLLGNLIYAAAQWGMLVVLAKWGSAVMVGQFALGLALTAPIILFANLKLRSVQATDTRDEYSFADYLGLRLLMIGGAIIAIIALALLGHYSFETTLVIALVTIAKVFDSLSDILYGLLQKHERMDRIACSMIIQGVLQLFTLAFVVLLTHNVVWGTAALALASALVTLGYDLRNALLLQRTKADQANRNGLHRWASLQPRIQLPILKSLIILTLPLGFTIALGSLAVNIPRYFIQHSFGEQKLGIFSAISYLIVAGSTIINALGQSATPRLAKYYVEQEWSAFIGLVLKLMQGGALVALIGLVAAVGAGHFLLNLIYGPLYADNVALLIWLVIAAGLQFIYVFLGTALSAMRNFRVQLPIQVLSCLIVSLLCLMLIPHWGLTGAAWSVLGVGLFETVAYSIVLVYNLRATRFSPSSRTVRV